MKKILLILAAAAALGAGLPDSRAAVPQIINYQGRIVSNGTNFNGTGQFKFVLLDGASTPGYWNNSGSLTGTNQPTTAVAVPVVNGLYSVLLGDTNASNMTAIPLTVFNNADVRLRVWFNNGVNGFQMLTPDQRIAAVGYALMAATVPDGAITAGKLNTGAVSATNLANGAVTAAKLAPGAVATALGNDLNIGTNGVCGRLDVYSTDIGTPGVTIDGCTSQVSVFQQANGIESGELAAKSWGGYLTLRDDIGSRTLEAGTASAGGGQVALWNTRSNLTVHIQGDDANGGGSVNVRNTNGNTRAEIIGQGNDGGGEVILRNDTGRQTVYLQAAEATGQGGQLLLYNGSGINTVQIDGDDGGHGGWIGLYNQDGSLKIQLDANASGGARVTTAVLEITGGADLSENFDITSAANEPKPGMIVCIDPENPGRLLASSKAYDSTVAGIISGAGGIETGMLMGQRGTKADGKHPVALTGRVYCMVDADAGAIRPGDLITTSDTPGHGMKASDRDRAQGAILGKAMTGLSEGKGLVLVLVSLQ